MMLSIPAVKTGIRNYRDQNREFYDKILKIAIPIATQSVIMSALNMVDQIMVGQLGENAIDAVGLSNRLITILSVVLNAIAAGISIYTAQLWGKKEKKGIGRLLGVGLFAGGIITAAFVLLAVFAPEFCIGIFSTDKVVVANGAIFLRIVGYSFIPSMLTTMYSAVLRSTAHVKLPMIASITGVVTGVALDYVLIFGHFGFPRLGLRGTAIGTIIARCIEFLIIFIGTYAKKLPAAYSIREMIGIPDSLFKKFLGTTYPLVLNEFLWVLGETAYAIIYGHIGTSEYAAVNITAPIQGLTIGMLSGLAGATGVILGNALGASEYDKACNYSKKIIRLGAVLSLTLGILIVLFSRFYVLAYKVSPETSTYSEYLLIAFAFFLWVKVSNMIISSGILSSGGDSKFIFAMESSTTWLFGVPSGFLAAFVFHFPVYIVYAILSCEEVIRFIIGMHRVKSRKWIRNLVSGV